MATMNAMIPGLTEVQRRMVETVRRLAQGKFRGRAEQWLDGTFGWGASETLRDLIGMRIVAGQDDGEGIISLNRLQEFG